MKGNSEFRIRNSEEGEGRKFRIKNEELREIQNSEFGIQGREREEFRMIFFEIKT